MTQKQSKLGTAQAAVILTGGMIGSAIFSLSGLTMTNAGPAAAVSWIAAGVIMLIYGLLMAELSVLYPRSGGVYVFPRRAFGGKKGIALGWLSCWSSILTNIAAISFAAIYIGIYLSVAFPAAASLQIPLAVASVVFCVILNFVSFSAAGRLQTVLVSLLVATIAVFVCAAFFGGKYDASLLRPFFTQGAAGPAGFVSVIPTAIIGYSAVTAIAFMVSEVKDPNRTVPRSAAIAVAVVCVIYALVIFATLGLITAGYLAENPGMQYIPLFAACFTALSLIPWLSSLVSVSACLALLTTMSVCFSMNSRAVRASAEDGILPAVFAKSNRFGAPAAAAAVTGLITAAVACFPQLTEQIVNFGAVFNCITIALTVLALLKARKTAVYYSGGFRAPGGAVLPVLELAVLIVCNISGAFTGGGAIWLYTLVFLGIGLLFLPHALRVNHGERFPGEQREITGVVVRGNQIGRTLGFPTANINPGGDVSLPLFGSYAGIASYGGKLHPAVCCTGTRPSVKEGQNVNVEVHILDDDVDLYGKELSVVFLRFLRPQEKFPSLDALKAAIASDKQKALAYFKENPVED